MDKLLNLALFEEIDDNKNSIILNLRSLKDFNLNIFGEVESLENCVKKPAPGVALFHVDRLSDAHLGCCANLRDENETHGIIFILSPEISGDQIEKLVDVGADLVVRRPVDMHDLRINILLQAQKMKKYVVSDDKVEINKEENSYQTSQDQGCEMFQEIINTTPVGVFLINNDRNIVHHNKQVLDVLLTKKEYLPVFFDYLLANHSMDILRELDRNHSIDFMAVLDLDSMRKEHRALTKGKGKLDLKIRISNFIAKDENQMFLVFINDYTAFNATKENHRKLEQAVMQSPNSILITDDNGNIEFANPEFTRLTGYTQDESIGKNPGFLKSGNKTPEEYKILWDTIKSGKVWKGEFNNRKKNGEEYIEEAVISPIKNEEGKITHFMAIKKDVSEQKEWQRQIRLLSNAINQSNRSILIIDHDFKIMYTNRRYLKQEKILDTVLGKKYNYIDSNATVFDHNLSLDKCLSKGIEWGGELQIKRGENHYDWIHQTISPIHDENGMVSHYLVVREDINEKKRLLQSYQEEQKKANQLAEVKSRFLSNMSHEIRTPLNGIIGLISVLMKKDPTEEQLKYIQLLNFTSDHLLSLINNILDLNKIDEGKLTLEYLVFDLGKMLQNLIDAFQIRAVERGNTITLDYHKELTSRYYFDKTRLTQIISNLLNNAIKFTQDGEIHVSVRPVKDFKDKTQVRIEVKDTGIGIKKEHLNKIFERFTQADASIVSQFGGSGLGLSIIKKLLELMKSKIFVSSEEGKGSTFYFDLILEKDKGDTGNPQPEISPEGEMNVDLNILSVDDNAVNQLITENYLKELGIHVDLAKNGYEAMEKIKSKKYNIVLMDIQMPGINGFEVTRIIRSKEDSYFKSVPIIAVSASSSQQQQDNARLVGMNHYLIKPYYPDELKLLLIKFGNFKIPKNGVILPEKLVHNTMNNNSLLSIEKRIDEFSGSNDAFKMKLIDSFIDGFQELLDESKKSITTRNLKDLRRIHHKLKSSMIILKLDDLNSIMETSKAFLRNEIELGEDELLSSFEGYILKLKDMLMQLRRQIKIKLRVNSEDVMESNDPSQ